VPSVRETSEGEFEIVIRAASRPNYIQVAVVENRLLLTNGVHKVCALHKMGYTHCVCVVRQVNDLAEAGIDQRQTTLFRDAIFKSGRPALVTDFLNPLATAPLTMRAMYQVLQITFNVGTITVPALSKNKLPKDPSPQQARVIFQGSLPRTVRSAEARSPRDQSAFCRTTGKSDWNRRRAAEN